MGARRIFDLVHNLARPVLGANAPCGSALAGARSGNTGQGLHRSEHCVSSLRFWPSRRRVPFVAKSAPKHRSWTAALIAPVSHKYFVCCVWVLAGFLISCTILLVLSWGRMGIRVTSQKAINMIVAVVDQGSAITTATASRSAHHARSGCPLGLAQAPSARPMPSNG